MANLSKLSELFTGIQNEITSLDNQKTKLTQEVATKQSKLTFIEQSIVDLTAKRTKAEQSYQETTNINADRLHDDKIKLADVQKQYDVLRDKLVLAESDIATMQKSTDEEVKRLQTVIDAKKQQIAEAMVILEQHNDILKIVQAEITDSKQAATVLDQQVTDKVAETSKAIASLELDIEVVAKRHRGAVSRLDAKQDELEDITQLIQDKQAEVDDINNLRSEFEKYKESMTAILKAREASLLEREQQLEFDLAAAKRRGSVLS